MFMYDNDQMMNDIIVDIIRIEIKYQITDNDNVGN